jgi:hypothetical protein
MPRAKIELEPWKEQIQAWIKEGQNTDEIRRNLWKEGKVQCSEKTFRRILRDWEIYLKQPYLKDLPALRKRITEIFNEGRLTDAEAIQQLKKEGFEVRAKTYQNQRKEMGLLKRSQPGFRRIPTENATPAEEG